MQAQIRLALLRLGQLQANKDSQGAITRREIASLLQQRNIRVARTKAQELMREDALGDLSVILEMHLGILLEHFNELDSRYVYATYLVFLFLSFRLKVTRVLSAKRTYQLRLEGSCIDHYFRSSLCGFQRQSHVHLSSPQVVDLVSCRPRRYQGFPD